MKIPPIIQVPDHMKLTAPQETHKELGENQSARDVQLIKQSNELEAVFLTQLIKSMEKTIPEGMSGGGKNSLSSMMFGSVMGDAMTKGGGIGLSKMIFESLRSMDEPFDPNDLGGEDYLQSISALQGIGSLEDNE